MSKTRKVGRRGGAKRLSEHARTAKKHLKDIAMAEKVVTRKQKKLQTAEKRLTQAQAKLEKLMEKFNSAENELVVANSDLDYYRRQLSYTNLQETDKQ